jgi:pimeloyl-ACP methyl ester carboxylesterase
VDQEITRGYAPVNGLEVYYEVHGAGQPLVLLHGGLDTITQNFERFIPLLAGTREVIAVELQGHGHAADSDRPLSYEHMADDVAAVMDYLGIERADLFGFSVGGGVAMQAAIRHPKIVRKLLVASAPYKREGWHPEVLAAIASMDGQAMEGSPWHAEYVRIAPKPEDWPRLVAKVRAFVPEADYDWTDAVRGIESPTLIVVGDADSIRLTHALEMFALLGGGQGDGDLRGRPCARLAVVPDTTHLTMLSRVDLLLPIITAFLDAPTPVGR